MGNFYYQKWQERIIWEKVSTRAEFTVASLLSQRHLLTFSPSRSALHECDSTQELIKKHQEHKSTAKIQRIMPPLTGLWFYNFICFFSFDSPTEIHFKSSHSLYCPYDKFMCSSFLWKLEHYYFFKFFFVLNQTCQRILFKSIGTIVKVSQTRAQVPDKETKLKNKKKKENTCGNFASLPKQWSVPFRN